MFSRNKQLAIELARLQGAVAALVDEVRGLKSDHEQRIRAIERWRYSVPLTAGAAVVAAIIQWVHK